MPDTIQPSKARFTMLMAVAGILCDWPIKTLEICKLIYVLLDWKSPYNNTAPQIFTVKCSRIIMNYISYYKILSLYCVCTV